MKQFGFLCHWTTSGRASRIANLMHLNSTASTTYLRSHQPSTNLRVATPWYRVFLLQSPVISPISLADVAANDKFTSTCYRDDTRDELYHLDVVVS